MEETREQPIMEPTNALNEAETSVVSEIGSQTADLGKFKNPEALLDAYNNLQSEFTKKCQKLSEFEKDKIVQDEAETNSIDNDNLAENVKKTSKSEEITSKNAEIEEITENPVQKAKQLELFLEQNSDALKYVDEIKKHFDSSIYSQKSPYEVAWANVVLSHLKDNTDKISDPIINQYVLSDENVKNKIIENYLNELSEKRPPLVMSSHSGERLSGVLPDNPTTLEEAKKITRKMFS